MTRLINEILETAKDLGFDMPKYEALKTEETMAEIKKVRKEDVDYHLSNVVYETNKPQGRTVVTCLAYTESGFMLAAEHAACVHESEFDIEIGRTLSKQRAKSTAEEKLWEIGGILLKYGCYDKFRAPETESI